MNKNKLKKHLKPSSVSISVNTKLYPLEAIYGASYNFIDQAYIFLDGDPSKKVNIKLKLKPNAISQFKNIQELKKEFLNELLNTAWRYQISHENKNLREFILGTALLGSLSQLNPSEKFFTDTKSVIEKPNEEEEIPDPLGIAIPWEEKFKPSKRTKTKKE